MKQKKSVWRIIRNKIADLFDLENKNYATKIKEQNILFKKQEIEIINAYTDAEFARRFHHEQYNKSR